MEQWKQFENSMYDVSTLGNVRSRKTGLILAQQFSKKGYPRLNLAGYGKKFVHRLVALVFLPKVDGKPHVNHQNVIKADNRLDNLEWCDVYENNKHAEDNGVGSLPISYVVIDMQNNIVGEYESYSSAIRQLKTTKGYVFIDKREFSDEKRIESLRNRARKPYSKRSVSNNRKFNSDAILLIRELSSREHFYPARIASIFNVNAGVIRAILNGKIYTDVV